MAGGIWIFWEGTPKESAAVRSLAQSRESAKWKISNTKNKFGKFENYTYLCIVEQKSKILTTKNKAL